MSQPQFQEHATAYLDVLGFKILIEKCEQGDSESLHKFQSLLRLMDEHVAFDDKRILFNVPKNAIPKYIFVSDSIILTAPLCIKRAHKKYCGLISVLLKSINLSHKLLDMGFIVRGGVSVGSVFFHKGNIYGSGYVDAYHAEHEASVPRILLTSSAKKHYEESDLTSRGCLGLVRRHENDFIVDSLSPHYWSEDGTFWEDRFERYRNTIVSNINNLADENAIEKWKWMASFFNDTIDKYQLTNAETGKIPAARMMFPCV